MDDTAIITALRLCAARLAHDLPELEHTLLEWRRMSPTSQERVLESLLNVIAHHTRDCDKTDHFRAWVETSMEFIHDQAIKRLVDEQ